MSGTTRRAFVAAGAGVALHGDTTPTGPIGVAFLGTTHSHGAAKLKIVRASPEYRIVALWDEDPAVRKRLSDDGGKVPASVKELLADAAVEAVIVESDVPDHARHARLALEAGKHVHLEKPPATTVREFRQLLDLAARNKLVFQQGYMWRYHPGFQAIRDAVRQATIGDVYLVTGVIHKSALDDADRRAWGRFAGGHMFELGSHLIDQMVRLMGRPQRVSPFLRKHGKADDQFADNTIAVLEWPGALGLLVGASLAVDGNRFRSFEVAGTKGTLTLAPLEPGDLYLDVNRKRERIPIPRYSRYEDDLKEFAAAVRKGTRLRVTPEEDLAVQEVLIQASGMKG